MYEGVAISGVPASLTPCASRDTDDCYRRMPLPELARMAQVNDKRAQHELAERSAAGCGMPSDFSRAKRLFAQSKTSLGGGTRAFLPDNEGGTVMSTETLQSKVFIEGYEPAGTRLAALRFGNFHPLPVSSWPAGICGEISSQRADEQ